MFTPKIKGVDMRHIVFLCILVMYASCKNEAPKQPTTKLPTEVTKAVNPNLPLSPDRAYGALFHAVQMGRVFEDGKTFVDCTPNKPISQIVSAYEALEDKSVAGLKAFVLQHFIIPLAVTDGFRSDRSMSVTQHVNALWPVLTRQSDVTGGLGTLIPLPKSYVVPGGRFREIYYWDSYFTMLGLQASGQQELMNNMCDNFQHLIMEVGHIPNGNRSYYLSRSQPPFFSLMVRLLTKDAKSYEEVAKIYAKYVGAMELEYQFWMTGQASLTQDYAATARVVRMPDGVILNRYFDHVPTPRPESYREDMETIRSSGRDSVTMCTHLKAGAESGWDYSSRWGANTTLKEICTVDIAPVDLNCLMWHMEQTISEAYEVAGNKEKAAQYRVLAEARKKAINTYFYDSVVGYYKDYNFVNKKRSDIMSLAGVFPLFFNLQPASENERIAKTVESTFLRSGGVVTTNNKTGQQWDAPNGWAPLQYMTVMGLRNAKAYKLANEIKDRWLAVNEKVFKKTGKMLEKYNVEDISLESGGGEYPVQDGFGWTNGVYQALKLEKPIVY
jgi:alpha,alpha-trehalase